MTTEDNKQEPGLGIPTTPVYQCTSCPAISSSAGSCPVPECTGTLSEVR